MLSKMKAVFFHKKQKPDVGQLINNINTDIEKRRITIRESLERLPNSVLISINDGHSIYQPVRHAKRYEILKKLKNNPNLINARVYHVSHDHNWGINPNARKDADVAILEIGTPITRPY